MRFLLVLMIGFLLSTFSYASENPWAVSLLAGIPHPINLAVYNRGSEKFSTEAALGSLSLPFTSANGTKYTLGVSNFDIRGRWHPFSGAFVLGGILGVQNLFGSAKADIVSGPQSVPTTVNVTIKGLYLTPHIGWIWTFGFGLTLGLEFGEQIPLTAASTVDPVIDDPNLNSYLSAIKATPQYANLLDTVNTAVDKIGRIKFPYTIIRFGWAF